MTLLGKGFFIWQIPRCEDGNAAAIANLSAQSGFSHVLIKVADGKSPYNADPDEGIDLVPAVAQALRAQGIQVWGWHYVYGLDPIAEANIAIQRVQELNLDGYAIDAERPFKQPGKDEAARVFMDRLRASLPNYPIALSSYRYPSMHPIPWQEFLEKCDINMPQVYWEQSHNPGEQLIRSLREFQAITPFRPLIPTGSAYRLGNWQPTPADVNEFLVTAQNLNMSAANFYEWANCRQYLPDVWDTVAAYDWVPGATPQGVLQRYFDALNAHDVNQVLELYNTNAVHVTPSRTLRGLDSIREWYQNMFNQILPNATFTLTDVNPSGSSLHFTWTAQASTGRIEDGKDTFGLVSNKITYHYTYFTLQ